MIKKLILFVAIPLVGINIVLRYTSGYYKELEEYQQIIERAIATKDLQIVFFGDSHGMELKNEYLNSNTYNLSTGGDGILEMYVKFQILLKNNIYPKCIFISSDYQMFSKRREFSSNRQFLSKYILQTNSQRLYGESKLSVLACLIPFFDDGFVEYFNRNIRFLLFSSNKNKSNDLEIIYSFTGGETEIELMRKLEKNDGLWAKLPVNVRDSIAKKTGIVDHFEVGKSEKYLNAYSSIIKLAQNNNIKVYGIKFPSEKIYLQQCETDISSKLDHFLSSKTYLKCIDYTSLYHDSEFFKNEDHLNKNGALNLIKQIEKDTELNLLNNKYN